MMSMKNFGMNETSRGNYVTVMLVVANKGVALRNFTLNYRTGSGSDLADSVPLK
jgi:hypothetical protein